MDLNAVKTASASLNSSSISIQNHCSFLLKQVKALRDVIQNQEQEARNAESFKVEEAQREKYEAIEKLETMTKRYTQLKRIHKKLVDHCYATEQNAKRLQNELSTTELELNKLREDLALLTQNRENKEKELEAKQQEIDKVQNELTNERQLRFNEIKKGNEALCQQNLTLTTEVSRLQLMLARSERKWVLHRESMQKYREHKKSVIQAEEVQINNQLVDKKKGNEIPVPTEPLQVELRTSPAEGPFDVKNLREFECAISAIQQLLPSSSKERLEHVNKAMGATLDSETVDKTKNDVKNLRRKSDKLLTAGTLKVYPPKNDYILTPTKTRENNKEQDDTPSSDSSNHVIVEDLLLLESYFGCGDYGSCGSEDTGFDDTKISQARNKVIPNKVRNSPL